MDEKLKKLEQIKRLKEKVEYINKFMHPSKLFRPKSQLDFDKSIVTDKKKASQKKSTEEIDFNQSYISPTMSY